MNNIPFDDKYAEFKQYEIQVKNAAICANTHHLKEDLEEDLNNILLLLQKFDCDWDDDLSINFKKSLNRLKNSINHIMTSVTGYSDAEKAYIVLDQEFQILKDSTEKWRKSQNPPSDQLTIYYDTVEKENKKTGKIYYEKKFNDSKYNTDYTDWFNKIKQLRENCIEASNKIKEIFTYLESVDGLNVLAGETKSSPNLDATMPFVDLFSSDSLNLMTYGVDQNGTRNNLTYTGYIVSDIEPLLPYLSEIKKEFPWFNENSEIHKKRAGVSVTKFEDLCQFLIDKLGMEEASKVISSSFSRNTPDYSNDENTVAFLMNKYQIDKYTSWKILEAINYERGACGYAAVANAILEEYKDNSLKFEQDFGFPMYYNAVNQYQLDTETLLADLFVSANTGDSDKNLYHIDSNGNLIINPLYDKQTYIAESLNDKKGYYRVYLDETNKKSSYLKDDLINNFVNQNGNALFVSETSTFTNINDSSIKLIQETLQRAADSNQKVILAYGYNHKENSVPQIYSDNGILKDTPGEHAVYVTGFDDENIYISSWGTKYTMPYSAMFNSRVDLSICNVEGV